MTAPGYKEGNSRENALYAVVRVRAVIPEYPMYTCIRAHAQARTCARRALSALLWPPKRGG